MSDTPITRPDPTDSPDGAARQLGESTDPEPDAPERVDVVPLDLDRLASDLDGVEAALRRLDDGSYWTDEVTGEQIPDDVLATDPIARRAR